jgi:protein-glutamine gamma-glutamyltransferase
VTATPRLLAGLLAIHLLILRPPAAILLPAIAVLLAGEILRVRRIYLPPLWGAMLLGCSLVAVAMVSPGIRPQFVLGGLAGIAGGIALLSRLTPARGLWILFGILLLLVAIVLTPYTGMGGVSVILDVVVLFLLSERIRRPPEVVVSFWISMLRSLRVVVPVALVVSTVFWLFPNLSMFSTPTFTGFAGGGDLSPGGIASLAQSRRVALVAQFAKGDPLPTGGDLYWRGQVLDQNAGLRWTEESRRPEGGRTLEVDPPDDGFPGWYYEQNLTSNLGGIVPVLDHAVHVEARRAGVEVAVFDRGAAVLSAVGRGALSLTVSASSNPMVDAPEASIADRDIEVPGGIRKNPAMQDLVERVFRPNHDLPANLRALADYFQDSDFTYTMRPGRIPDLENFLFSDRMGFCGHYAAASANLLRLGGIPARIVTGFRGGEWNPWLRTLTIRDSDAHAWVEAWDESAGFWRRFDPTDAVAPEQAERIAQNMKANTWPWYRLGLSYLQAKITISVTAVEGGLAWVMSSEAWEYVQPTLAVLYLLAAIVWLIRRQRGQARTIDRVMDELERRAHGSNRARRAGETPLAWLARLENDAGAGLEADALRGMAGAHEDSVYRAEASESSSALRTYAKRLHRLWRLPPPKRDW